MGPVGIDRSRSCREINHNGLPFRNSGNCPPCSCGVVGARRRIGGRRGSPEVTPTRTVAPIPASPVGDDCQSEQ
jgi:hypothetical protein